MHALIIPFCFMMGPTTSPPPAADGFESPGVLIAAELLPDELLSSEHHRVQPAVHSDGYMNTYVIESEFGNFEVAGNSLLRERVREIEALAQLSELSRTEVFAKAAIDAGLSPINAIVDFSKNPVKTITGIPGGITRMFKRYSRRADLFCPDSAPLQE